jgi:hypothetical protein
VVGLALAVAVPVAAAVAAVPAVRANLAVVAVAVTASMPAPALVALVAAVVERVAVPAAAVPAAVVAVSPPANTGRKGGGAKRRLLFAPVRPSGHQAEAMATSYVADLIGSSKFASTEALALFIDDGLEAF